VEDRKQGKGVYKNGSMTILDGQWNSDLFTGNGKRTYKDGVVYSGGWINGLKCGQGEQRWPTGMSYSGALHTLHAALLMLWCAVLCCAVLFHALPHPSIRPPSHARTRT